MSPILLYENAVSGNCHKVRLILALLGIGYETRSMSVTDHSDRVDVLGGLSPTLNVPTVVLEDGRPLAESNAILWYFADGTKYLPDDRYERAQVLQWMFFEQYKHEPAIAVVRFWVSLAAGPPPAGIDLEERAAAGHAALAVMERHLADREYFVGSAMTIADISLYGYTHVASEGGFDLQAYPAVRHWIERLELEPGVVPMSASSEIRRQPTFDD